MARRQAWVVALCAWFVSASATAQPERDTVSDGVGSTAGVFRVDESGAATYKVPIVVPPGTAGVTPTMSLDYSSQGSMGVSGKGWSIGGQSSISRCRKTREAGDFFAAGGGPIDGYPPPVNFSQSDVFCLDGQRLLLVSSSYGANGAVYRPELEPWTRVTSIGGNNSTSASAYTGPLSFTVERKDGSISEYGNTADSRVERNLCGGSTGVACAVSTWALNRVEDSTGNYMTYHYEKYLAGVLSTNGAGSDEFALTEVRYTGKRVLSGQLDSMGQPIVATGPYARVLFGYTAASTAYQQLGWQSGSRLAQTRQLNWVKVQDPFAGTPKTLRYYVLDYQTAGSNSGLRELKSIQECNKGPGDTGYDTAQVCYPATTFTASTAKYEFNAQADSDVARDVNERKGARFGDVDGDGRLDLVWLQKTTETTCKHRLYVSYGDRFVESGVSKLTLATPAQTGICVHRGDGEIDGAWQLLDYDGDGRDDLMLASASGASSRWRIHRSIGRPASSSASAFDAADLLSSITIPALAINSSSTQLIDLNGDGLTDVLYPIVVESGGTTSSQLYMRFRERAEVSTGVFELRFGLQYPVTLNFASTDPCSSSYDGIDGASCVYSVAQHYSSSLIAAEFNGDGRGDLMLDVMRIYGSMREDVRPRLSYVSPDELARLREELPAGATGSESFWYFFTSSAFGSIFPTMHLAQYSTQSIYFDGAGEMPADGRQVQLADFNGDGLTDLLYRVPSVASAETWRLRLNTGAGFSTSSSDSTGVKNPALVQVADINGDGRADLLYPPSENTCVAGGTSNTSRPFCVRYGRAGAVSLGGAQHVPGGGAHATTAPFDYEHYFADLDGDGAPDYLRFKRVGGASDLFTSRSSTRHQMRDAIVQITDGLGAVTQINYQPLTNSGIYRRDTGALTAPATNGRGSPTFDLLAPMYVVASASSSAPVYDDAAALSTVSYRYAGARMQSGGRGYLGFRELVTYDGAHAMTASRHVVSRTTYRQDFPFIGSPEKSQKFVLSGAVSHGSTAINACRTDPEVTSQSCFYSLGSTWTATAGTKISESLNVWACQGTGNGTVCPIADNPVRQECITTAPSAGPFNPLGSQQPIFPYLTGSVEDGFAYNTTSTGNGNLLSHSVSLFCHEDGYGNLTYSKLDRWDGANNPLSVQVTNNSYTNDATKWRLGRLDATSVDTSRTCVAGAQPVDPPICSAWETRDSSFAYDMSSTAKTGFLTSQTVQPGGDVDEELREMYTLDGYGNRSYVFECSAMEADGTTLTPAECRTPSRVKHRPDGISGEITAVHRYSRATYTPSTGRYLVSTRLPFYSVSGTNNVTEQPALTIGSRDEFGNVTQQTDARGLVSTAKSGALGRPYYTADNTGQSSTVTYRWCTDVSCPADAVYRSQTVSAVSGSQSAAPTTWIYHDRLGRPVLAVTQAFAAGVTGEDFSAVCTYYDKKTRTERSSEPFFLTTAASGGVPDFAGGSYDACESPSWNRAEFDVLGRPTKTVLPDGYQTTTDYSGLVTTVTNPKSQKQRETRNALGEVVQVTQANAVTPSLLGMSVDSAYDTQGNLVTMTRNAGQGDIVTTFQYDAVGRRTKVIDPDRGTEQTFYNAAGEVIRTIDGAGADVRIDIDAMGRMWRRFSGKGAVSNEPIANGIFGDGFEAASLPSLGIATDTWVFDTATNGLGLLHYEERVADGQPTYRRTISYDNRGRVGTRATLLDGASTQEQWFYDALGRNYRETDASGGTVERTFTARGFPLQLRNAAVPAEVYQQINAQNARGQVTEEARGAASIEREFHPQRAWLMGLTTTAATTLQNLSYDYDALGNAKFRNDLRGNQREDFDYDGLNRVKTAKVTVGANPQVTVLNMTYDNLGNVCSKNGESYTYAGRDGCNATDVGASRSPHAVSKIGNKNFLYQDQGQLDYAFDTTFPAQDRWFAYDGMHQLSIVMVGSLFAPSAELEMRYGPSGDRYLRRENVGGSTTTTRYLGNVERITRPSGVVETKRYIGGVLIQTSFSNGTPTTKRFVYPDALGSTDVITNESGTLQERLSFDGHGSRRTTSDWRYGVSSYTPTNTNDGFTGHEHLDPFGLIHMNGRVYDPKVGRFIQADPMTDKGIQGLNRYSYVNNNPFTLTDPTGYFSWNRALRTVAAIVITVYTGGAASGAWTFFGASIQAGSVAAFGVSVAGGFAAGAVQTGTLKGGLYGAFGAAAFFGVGQAFTQANASWAYTGGQLNGIGTVAKTVSHGIAGGVMSDLQGGKFGHGFVSAGVTQAASPQIQNLRGITSQIVGAAVLGGTVSAATGGKFANGAITAAFSHAFNDVAHGAARQKVQDRVAEANKRLLLSGGNRPFDSADAAALFWHDTVGDLPGQYEFGSLIFESQGKFFLGPVGSSYNTSMVNYSDMPDPTGGRGNVYGTIHSHPRGTTISGGGQYVTSEYPGSYAYTAHGVPGDHGVYWMQGYGAGYVSGGGTLHGWSLSRFRANSGQSISSTGRAFLNAGSYCVAGCGP